MSHIKTSRGIRNTSKLSCHISAAIQMIFHVLSTKDRQDIISLSESMMNKEHWDLSNAESFIISMGQLMKEMGSACLGGVDPNDFYRHLDINSTEVGDACNSLRSLIRSIRSNVEYIRDHYESLGYSSLMQESASSLLYSLNSSFFNGILSTQIIGSKVVEDKYNDLWKVIRKKETEKAFPCPLPIPVQGQKSLFSSLQTVVKSQQSISGYNWDTAVDYVEERSKLLHGVDVGRNTTVRSNLAPSDSTSFDDSSHSYYVDDISSSDTSSTSTNNRGNQYDLTAEWRTVKNTKPESYPKSLVLQLIRFHYDGNKVCKIVSGIDVPSILDLRSWVPREKCCVERDKFFLSGAIMYRDEQNNSGEYEAGHYYSFMKEEESENHGINCNVWKKIDDEKVSTFALNKNEYEEHRAIKVVPENIFLGLLGGKTKKKGSFATALCYKSYCRCHISEF